MAIDDRTVNLDLPLPHPDNQLSEDVSRIRTSFEGVDTAYQFLQDNKLANDQAAADSERLGGKPPADYVLTDDLNPAVRATALTGVSFATAQPVTATDSLIVALGKLQAQSTARVELSSIVDGLTSTLADAPLSANQGRVLKGLIDNINAVLQSDDGTLDELQEIVDFIKANRNDLDALSISNIAGLQTALDGKANTSGTYSGLRAQATTKADVGLSNVDNTSDANKPLSADAVAALGGKANTSTSITAGNGLTGGGSLAGSRTITLGAPGTITGSSTNSVSSTSHTHDLSIGVGDVSGLSADLAGKANTSTLITAGSGLSGGGSLATNRTLSVDSSVVRTSRSINSGTGLSGGGNLGADRTLSVNYGTTAGTAAQGNDSRITGAAQKSANLSDLSSAMYARGNLGLESMARAKERYYELPLGGDFSGDVYISAIEMIFGILVTIYVPIQNHVSTSTPSSDAVIPADLRLPVGQSAESVYSIPVPGDGRGRILRAYANGTISTRYVDSAQENIAQGGTSKGCSVSYVLRK